MDADGNCFMFLDMFVDDHETVCAAQFLDMSTAAAIIMCNMTRNADAKIEYYAERTVPLYGIDQFRKNYRLSREAFDMLAEELCPHLVSDHKGGDLQVDPHKQLLLFCWYMANQDSFREVGHLFGLSVSTVHAVIYRLLDAFLNHLGHFIAWPDIARQNEISDDIQRRSGLNGMIGFVDGTHIRLSFRPNEDQDYVNRKGFPSLQLQIVADPDMRIISMNTGWPGCAHDARVLRNSDVYTRAEGRQMFGNGKYIVGDSAYPCLRWLITVFKDNGRLTDNQRRFNAILSQQRQVVERTIGHLKCRFRRLLSIYIFDVKAICKIIHAACILHNLCVISGDELADFIENDQDQHPNNYGHLFGNDPGGVDLRNQLVQQVAR